MDSKKLTAQSLFSEDFDENASEKPEIEFISSISNEKNGETSTGKLKPPNGLVIPLPEKSGANLTENSIEFTREEEAVATTAATQKKLTWGLNLPNSRNDKRHHHSRHRKSSVPLLLQNRLPGLDACRNEEEQFDLDLKSRPESPSIQAYSAIPVSEFGAAMLRGMGWKGAEEDGLAGASSKKQPIKYVPRPERLGLGASEVSNMKDLKVRKPIEQALNLDLTKDEEDKLAADKVRAQRRSNSKLPLEVLAKHVNYVGIDEQAPKRIRLQVEVGSNVIITDGPHKDLLGSVRGKVHGRSDEWLIELKVNGEVVRERNDHVELFKYKPAVNAKEASDKFKQSSTEEPSRWWLFSGLKVKIVSKSSLARGKYYNRKGVILDVLPGNLCSLKLWETEANASEVIQSVPQSALQTVIPREPDPTNANVRYLKNDRGLDLYHAPFRILELDDRKQEAVIQSDEDPTVVFTASYDDVCEFIDIHRL